jgi:REP element-mobilizing transposase RayT
MSRPLRVQFTGACYHIINRGAAKQKIFKTEHHYHLFLKLLDEIHKRFQIEIHAYCLMPNHYHLLLQTPLPNLSRAMRHLDGIYTQRYNRDQQKDGAIFRGRYKSILVDAQSYLLKLSRYIHLNPIKSKLVKKPEDYPWSSYKYYLCAKTKPDWLCTEQILNEFGKKMQKYKYNIFIQEGIDTEIASFYSKLKLLPILGNEVFKKSISEKYIKKRLLSSEIVEHKMLNPTIAVEEIIKAVSSYYNVKSSDLFFMKQGNFNKPRCVAIYLACELTGSYTKLQEIANNFPNTSYSRIAQTNYRMTKLLSNQNNIRLINETKDLKKILTNVKNKT